MAGLVRFPRRCPAEHPASQVVAIVSPGAAAHREVSLAVFGKRDPATLAQMRACLQTDRTVAGAARRRLR